MHLQSQLMSTPPVCEWMQSLIAYHKPSTSNSKPMMRSLPVSTATMTVRHAILIHSFRTSSSCLLSIVLMSLRRRSTLPVRLSIVSFAWHWCSFFIIGIS